MKRMLYFMRHGETMFNVTNQVQGWCDSPLTALGIKQAKAAKQYFDNNHIVFSHLYTSGLGRANETMELICDRRYECLKGIKERNCGKFEGSQEYLFPFGLNEELLAPYGVESKMKVRERALKTIHTIMKQEDHTCVLMVSHGLVCAQLLEVFAQEEALRNARVSNCSVLKLAYDNGSFSLEEWIQPWTGNESTDKMNLFIK